MALMAFARSPANRFRKTRLSALPYATLCIEAQREVERLRAEGVHPEDWSRLIEIDTIGDEVSFSDIEAV